jgi:hypothetical protein
VAPPLMAEACGVLAEGAVLTATLDAVASNPKDQPEPTAEQGCVPDYEALTLAPSRGRLRGQRGE